MKRLYGSFYVLAVLAFFNQIALANTQKPTVTNQTVVADSKSASMKNTGEGGARDGGGGGQALEAFRKTGLEVLSFLRTTERGRTLVEVKQIDLARMSVANEDKNIELNFEPLKVGELTREGFVDPEKVNHQKGFDVLQINLYVKPGTVVEYTHSFVFKELLRSIERNDLVEKDFHLLIDPKPKMAAKIQTDRNCEWTNDKPMHVLTWGTLYLLGELSDVFPNSGNTKIRSLNSFGDRSNNPALKVGNALDSNFHNSYGVKDRYPTAKRAFINWLSENPDRTICELGEIADVLYQSEPIN